MKLRLLLLFFLVTMGIQAQEPTQNDSGFIRKGHFNFGISSNGLGYVKTNVTVTDDSNISQDNSYDYATYILGFDAGYLISDQIQIGLFTNLNVISNDSDTTTKYFGIGPKVNYYFKSNTELVPFISTSGGYFYEETNLYSREGYTWDLGAGLSYFLNKHIAFQALLQYQYKTYDFYSKLYYVVDPNNVPETPGYNTSQINFNIGFSIFL